jgi:hypothetical protein
MRGDICYEPMWISPTFVPYKETVMFIDPSGRGLDETAICIASFANGYIVIHELFGLQGGYDGGTLEKIARIAIQYKIKKIRYESNYGDGMFGQILKPIIASNCGQVCIEEFKVTGAKESRILRILEPVFSQHRLVFDTKVIREKENQIQITRLTDRRGCLKHDDRVDVLASAANYWSDMISIDPDTAIKKNLEEEQKRIAKDWMSNKRCIGLLGDRISGAILLNNKPLKKQSMFGHSILQHKRK